MITYIKIHVHVYVCMCVCVYVCVCKVCVCVCVVPCFFSSCQDLKDGELCLRSAMSRENFGGVATLTCESFDILGERCERQTEPSHSWFPPEFPSG